MRQSENFDEKLFKFREDLLQKDKEIENYKLRSKLTKQQKEALQFFQDSFLGIFSIINFRKQNT